MQYESLLTTGFVAFRKITENQAHDDDDDLLFNTKYYNFDKSNRIGDYLRILFTLVFFGLSEGEL